MTRTAWTPAELRGYRLAWIVEVDAFAGTIRAATYTLDLVTASGVLYIPGTVGLVDHQETLDLFTLSAEDEPLVIDMVAEGADVATLAASGHRLEGCPARVSQVRIDRDGASVDDYEDRCEFVAGYVTDAKWGPTANGGAVLKFGIRSPALIARSQMPTKHQRICRATWDTSFLSDEDLLAYPIIIGNPGKDDLDQDGCFGATRVAWLSKQYLYSTMLVGMGTIEATTVRIFNKAGQREGVDVNVGYEWTTSGAGHPTEVVYDNRGQNFAVVDYRINDYQTGGASAIGAEYEPPVEESEDDHVYFGMPDGGGTMWRGRLLRTATDVLAFVFEYARVRYDEGALQAASGVLDGYLIDTVIRESVDPLAWLRENLMPLLPISVVPGPRGVRVLAWRGRATPADAVMHLDADTENRLDPAEELQESSENGCASVELRYGRNARTGQYRYTRRVAAVAEDSTDYGQVEIRSNVTPLSRGFVSIRYATPGMEGHGITVTCTDTGVLGATYTASTRTLAVTFDGGVSDAEAIATQINTTATEFVASAGGESTYPWVSTTTPSVTTSVTDFGSAAHPSLVAAQARQPGTDPLEGEDRVFETPLVYDHGTAVKSVNWQAAAYGPSRRRWSVLGPEELLCGVAIGDDVMVSDATLGLSGIMGHAEGKQWRSDGVIGLRVVLDER